MTTSRQLSRSVAIACGGTGGHLFPGLAVADCLVNRGCAVTLFVSEKEVDQQAVKSAPRSLQIVTLPAVGLTPGRRFAFIAGFIRSYRAARKFFRRCPPQAALAMGGFTSAPPILAAKRSGARTFLHESNTIPGRANRWLSRVVDQVFVGFPQTAARFRHRAVTVTGTPVRPQFQPRDRAECRTMLGFDPARPVVLVMGGSQGAGGINELVVKSLPWFAKEAPQIQWLHLAGANDAAKIREAFAALNLKAAVYPFLDRMELALGAATIAVSRAGASSLAELAAMQLPAVLIPYPAATDNHQFHNARAFETCGAARLLDQKSATPEAFAGMIRELLANDALREKMQAALADRHAPAAAAHIAETILTAFTRSADSHVRASGNALDQPDQNQSRPGAIERQDFSAA